MTLGALLDAVIETISLVPAGQHVMVDPLRHLIYSLAECTRGASFYPT
jgi:hypothetical protein